MGAGVWADVELAPALGDGTAPDDAPGVTTGAALEHAETHSTIKATRVDRIDPAAMRPPRPNPIAGHWTGVVGRVKGYFGLGPQWLDHGN